MSKTSKTLLLALAISCLISSSPLLVSAVDWPMFGHDQSHSGHTTSLASPKFEILWRSDIEGARFYSSPAVAYGRIFLASNDTIYCLDELTGSMVWNYTLGGIASYTSPAVYDSRVYIGADDGNLYCLSLDGEKLWNYTIGGADSLQKQIRSSPTIADGMVFIGSPDGRVYALDAYTGTQIWNYTTGGPVDSSPAVSDGRVFVSSTDGGVYCLVETTGALIWNYSTGASLGNSSPAVDTDNDRVLVGSTDGNVYCLYEFTGEKIWNYTTGDEVRSSPAVAEGRVYVWSKGPLGRFYCLNESDGSLIWDKVGAPVSGYQSSPAVAANDMVFVTGGSYIFCLDASSGEEVWSYYTGYYASPPVVANGAFYFASEDGSVWAFGPRTYLYSISLLGATYYVAASSGSKISDFAFDQTVKKISFNVTGPPSEGGYCNITAPKDLFDAPPNVLFDGQLITHQLADNGTHYLIDFEYVTRGEEGNTVEIVRLYTMSLRTVDWSGLTLPNSTVSASGLGNITTGSKGWANFTDVPPDTYDITVHWRGSKVNQTSIDIITSNVTTDLRCRVYSTNFTDSFMDSEGEPLRLISSFRLVCPNGTTTSALAIGSYALQNGTYRWADILLRGKNVTPSPPPAFDPSDGTPTVYCNITKHYVEGEIQQNTTWTEPGMYILTDNVTVPEGVSLTIEEGVVVSFNGSYGLKVHGMLAAEGTDDNMIVFTSYSPDPSPGDWAGIYFLESGGDRECIIRYCVVEHSTDGIYADDASSYEISNNIFRENGRYSIHIHSIGAVVNVRNNTFVTDRQSCIIHVHDGEVNSSNNSPEIYALTVETVDPLGMAVPGAVVEVLRNGEVLIQSLTDSNGRAIFHTLEGEYQVRNSYRGIKGTEAIEVSKAMTLRQVTYLSNLILLLIGVIIIIALILVYSRRRRGRWK